MRADVENVNTANSHAHSVQQSLLVFVLVCAGMGRGEVNTPQQTTSAAILTRRLVDASIFRLDCPH